MIDPMRFAELKASARLPSPSRVALDLIDRLKRDDVALPEICRLIQSDPGLTGRLLKLANSAAYARPRPAVAITPEVLMTLGLPAIRSLVLAFSLLDGVGAHQSQCFDFSAFWSRALLEACAAQRLGALTRQAPAAEMFTLGLVADIGRLALAGFEPAAYDKLLETIGPHPAAERLAEAERAAFGFDHTELAAALLADWGFPKLFCEAVRWHALPAAAWPFEAEGRNWRITDTLALAHRLADSLDFDDAARQTRAADLEPAALRIGIGDWLNFADEVLETWREWGELLAVPTRMLTPFSALQREATVLRSSLRVLVIEDDPVARRLLEGVLGKAGFELRSTADAESGLELARGWQPEIVLTDMLLPGKSGLDLIRELRASEEGGYQYIIVISVLSAVDKLVEAFAQGADDYVVKPLDARVLLARMQAGARIVRLRQELVERNLQLAEALRRADEAALTDSVTGLPNRRYAMQRLAQEFASAERHGRPLSVLLIDIDHFRRINDLLGNAAGDAVLAEIALRLRDTVRLSDVVCRFGADEFLVIAVDTPLEALKRLIERIRERILAQPIKHRGQALKLAVSSSMAQKDADNPDVDQLIRTVGRLLDAAKARNR